MLVGMGEKKNWRASLLESLAGDRRKLERANGTDTSKRHVKSREAYLRVARELFFVREFDYDGCLEEVLMTLPGGDGSIEDLEELFSVDTAREAREAEIRHRESTRFSRATMMREWPTEEAAQ
jgi:hypothetical protein